MDAPISRRRALGALGGVGVSALLAACGARDTVTSAEVPTAAGTTATVQPQSTTSATAADLLDEAATCVLAPEQTEGPYYFDVDSIRSDIREDREGTTLRLAVRVQDADCDPLPNAVVDIWHCDAGGEYSGFESASQGGPGGGGGRTDEETYLRGAQVTNADGIAEFTTIYPGWYRGRTVHIHAKVHVDASTLLTTQLYFDEAVSDQVYRQAPYSARTGRDTTNDTDGIARQAGGVTVLTMREQEDGWMGAITLGVGV